jgi:hypothetical protein
LRTHFAYRTPLTIKNSPTNSFLLPRWGGIHIFNYHVAGEDNFKFPAKISVDMARVMGIWLGQLRTLLGVKERAGLSLLPLPYSGLRKGIVRWINYFRLFLSVTISTF